MKHTIQLKLYALGAALLIALHVARVTAAEPTTLPLLDDEAMIRVPVTLFGETRYFAVDTGAPGYHYRCKLSRSLGGPAEVAIAYHFRFRDRRSDSLSVPGVIDGRDSG